MRIVFLGTPEFACPSLSELVQRGHEVPLVVTQPDRPRGRGRTPSPTPVRVQAQRLGLPTLTLEPGSRAAVYARILAEEAALVVVVAFGHLVREPLLSAPRHGCLNVHASLLPRWRGAAPIHRAVLAGDTSTGVTTMRLTAGLDTGPVYASASTSIGPDETASQLHDRLAVMGAELLLRTVAGLSAGTLASVPQSAEGASWAPPLRKEEGTVDFAWPAQRVHDTVRALEDWPKVAVLHGRRRLMVGGSHRLPAGASATPAANQASTAGTVLQIGPEGMVVQCADGAVRFARLLPEGGRWMDAASYARGHGLAAGARLVPLVPGVDA